MSVPPNPCAWCLRDRGEAPKPEDSHGICEAHVAELGVEIEAWRKAIADAKAWDEEQAAAWERQHRAS